MTMSLSFSRRPNQLGFKVLLLSSLAACAANPPPVQSTPEPVSDPHLQGQLEAIAAQVDGPVGIAVIDVAGGAEYLVDGERPMAQQSTFKLWLGVAIVDAVQRREWQWDMPLYVGPEDLIYGYQPIAEEVGEGREFTVRTLFRWMLVYSDNPATDVLLRRLGGAPELTARLERLGLGGIRVALDERGLQARSEQVEEAFQGLTTEEAAERLRSAPVPNPATAHGVAQMLLRLSDGAALAAEGTAYLLGVLGEVETGGHRLRGGLSEGWTLAHKTGSGGTLADLTLATNDIGLLTSPSGRRFVVAVFVGPTTASGAECEQLIADVARAVVAFESQHR